jgi:3-hydroxymyristoyl/3-hydroxydecanoyl-(acyl carrier protein) dehydratase
MSALPEARITQDVVPSTEALKSPLFGAALLGVLPHRYPFLLLDSIEQYEPRRWIRGTKNFAAHEPMLCAPGAELPRTLGIEIIGQLAIALMNLSRTDKTTPPAILLGSLEGVRIGPAIPRNACIRAEARVTKLLSNGLIFSGETWCEGERLLSLETLIAIEAKPDDRTSP